MENFIPVCEPALLGNEKKYLLDAVESGWISSAGKYVSEFETQFAKYCGVEHGIGVCNGTVAIHLALVALGIGKGDEVIIPNFTMIATAFAVCYTGAIPVFVDADPNSWNISIEKIEAKITSKTKAIIPVHIMGLVCDMDPILALAKKYNLSVIEDAAEAHGAEYKGKKSGSFGHLATFSFFANKNLTTGEGGMVVTNDSKFASKSRYYKNLCFPLEGAREYNHADIGFNYRISNLHAAIGLAQLEKAEQYTEMRINNFKNYQKLLSEIKGISTQVWDETVYKHVHWMNAIKVDPIVYGRSRDELMDILKKEGIDSRKLFNGMHTQKSLREYGCVMEGEYTVTEDLSRNGLYLPSSSTLTLSQVNRICDVINGAKI
ncbi:DegT/DnrJ/EryC1/StrS family aminotransferase [Leptospira bouyouniensis]|uniref:DegT/DnrJ/EryC1/StrS family aminotransferase n=1 Tax=Leptospira bouyouniensis TaxID=2484911 RepID=UPI001090C592|nr:DegT/DnrJ/EryC1/StrS family aminotransferase [Leptospira bouyouniensis]TGM80951.1 DegT/DnrJ/EryC1/StrS family aminotransferase [Leptospira bouyouniensis]